MIEVGGIFSLILLIACVWAIIQIFQSRAGTGSKDRVEGALDRFDPSSALDRIDNLVPGRTARLQVLKPMTGRVGKTWRYSDTNQG